MRVFLCICLNSSLNGSAKHSTHVYIRMLQIPSLLSWTCKIPISLLCCSSLTSTSASVLLRCSIMARTMGSIIAVEAMLEIPMERMAVVLMNPNINLRDREKKKDSQKDFLFNKEGWTCKKGSYNAGFTPTTRTMAKARRLWRFHCSTAMATINPPTPSMVVSLKYWIETCKITTHSKLVPEISKCMK